jgi:acyl carrier protein
MVKKLKKIFEKIFKKKFSEKNFKKLKIDDIKGWDSMTNLDLIFAILKEFNFKFKTKDLENANSISFYLKYLKGKK